MGCASRRDFLKGLAGAGVWVACANCGVGGAGLPTTDVPGGNLSQLPVGTLRAVGGQPILIGRDAAGLYAMSAICTHASCDMTSQGSINDQGAFCSCHGSQFDANGAVLRGPARAPLPHLAVSADPSGAITIHPQQEVAASVRVAV